MWHHFPAATCMPLGPNPALPSSGQVIPATRAAKHPADSVERRWRWAALVTASAPALKEWGLPTRALFALHVHLRWVVHVWWEVQQTLFCKSVLQASSC